MRPSVIFQFFFLAANRSQVEIIKKKTKNVFYCDEETGDK